MDPLHISTYLLLPLFTHDILSLFSRVCQLHLTVQLQFSTLLFSPFLENVSDIPKTSKPCNFFYRNLWCVPLHFVIAKSVKPTFANLIGKAQYPQKISKGFPPITEYHNLNLCFRKGKLSKILFTVEGKQQRVPSHLFLCCLCCGNTCFSLSSEDWLAKILRREIWPYLSIWCKCDIEGISSNVTLTLFKGWTSQVLICLFWLYTNVYQGKMK